MKNESFFSRLRQVFAPGETQLAEDKPVQNETVAVPMQTGAKGSSGTCVQAGRFDEEYLQIITGREAADIFDKMRRSDARIIMVLRAVKNPIKGATWTIERAKTEKLSDADAEKHRALVEHVIFTDIGKPWKQLLHEILSFVDFGHSVFETTHKSVLNHPTFGNYTGIRNMGFRSQRTIEQWFLDPQTGKLEAIEQVVDGDLDRGKGFLRMDARFLTVFSMDKEGDNYEGISMLRPAYGPWFRKQMFLKLMAIGTEKSAVPTPVVTVPEGKTGTEQFDQLLKVLKAYTSHESNFITLPTGYEWNFAQNPFDPQKTKTVIDLENVEMVDAFLANFLNLGQVSANRGGSFALSFDLSDFFLGGLEYIASLICETFNDGVDNNAGLTEQIVRMNFGPQPAYPKMLCSGISDKSGKELAEIISMLVDKKVILPDDNLEENVRKRYKLPEPSEDGREERKMQPPAPPNPVPPDDEEDEDKKASDIRLAETPRGQITKSGKSISNLMTDHLTSVSDNLVDRVMRKFGTLPENSKMNAISDIQVNGMAAYKKDLTEEFALTSNRALARAQAEVPGHNSVKLAGTQFTEKDKLGRKRKLAINNLAELFVVSQGADLEKAVFFQFSSSLNSSFDSPIVLEQDILDAGREFAESASIKTGAVNAASQIINETRNAFFFEPEVLEEIQSFTFTNGDPKSPICQDLAGSTFRTDDAQANRFFPPLHHNCKSILVANLSKRRPKEITGLKPSKKELEKFITLTEAGVTMAAVEIK